MIPRQQQGVETKKLSALNAAVQVLAKVEVAMN
jgi:hypothetical protein